MPLNSHRFWMIIAGFIVALAAVIGVIIKPEAQVPILAVALGLKGLLFGAIKSDGDNRMGSDR
jgi:hypothetical protein